MFKKLGNLLAKSISGKEGAAYIKFAGDVVDSVNIIVDTYRDNQVFVDTFNAKLDSRILDETRPPNEVKCLKFLKEMLNTNKEFNLLKMGMFLKEFEVDDVMNSIKSVLNGCSQAYYAGNEGNVDATDPVIIGLRGLESYVGIVEKNPETGASSPNTLPPVRGSKQSEPTVFKSSKEACEYIMEGIKGKQAPSLS